MIDLSDDVGFRVTSPNLRYLIDVGFRVASPNLRYLGDPLGNH